MTQQQQQPVLIIGGGLSGLTLAHSLKHQGIPYKLFERDTGKSDRINQGWSMSMHFCLSALAKVMDPAHFSTLGAKASVNIDRPEDLQFSIVDGRHNNELLFAFDPSQVTKDSMYRINRKRFRAWLLEGLDVIWNKRLARYRILGDDDDNNDNNGGVEAVFTDGTTVQGSVLVGADGVHSAVGEQLMTPHLFHQATTVNPTRSLVVLRWLTEEEYSPLRALSKTQFSAYGALDQGETVCAFMSLNDIHPDPTVERRYQVILAVSRFDQVKAIPRYEHNADRLQLFKTWAKEAFEGQVQKVLLETPDNEEVTDLVIRERFPDTDALAKHQGRIALVGDAAHTMTMFRGEGGNHAILDATMLGQALGDAYNVDKDTTFYEAIEKYNQEMIVRGTNAVKGSHDAAYIAHNSPETVVKTFQDLIESVKNGTFGPK